MSFSWLMHDLVLPISLPLLAGLLCLLLPSRAGLRSGLMVLVSAAVLVLAWQCFGMVGSTLDIAGMPLFRVDALNGFVLLAVAFFSFLIAIYSAGFYAPLARRYAAYFLWTLAAACGALLANDLLLLLVFWGFMGFTLYRMVGLAGPAAAPAARKSLMIIGGTDALMVLGIVLYWQLTGSTQIVGGGPGEAGLSVDSAPALAAFLLLAAGALAKAGAVPFQSWVPDVGEKADAPVSAFLPASLDKLLGIYLLARCVLDLFVPTAGLRFVLMLIGAITLLSMALMALLQNDLKRLLSYTAVSQVGYIILGLASGTVIGLAGGLFHMLNHAIYKSALFLCAGMVEKEAGETDLDRLGGLARLLPVTFVVCTVAALAGAGIPPLNGFASKWLVYQGILESGSAAGAGMGWVFWLAIALVGSALTLAAFLKMLHAVFLCKPSPEVQKAFGVGGGRAVGAGLAGEVSSFDQDKIAGKAGSHSKAGSHVFARFLMLAPMVVLAVLCVLFGVFAFRLPLAQLVLPAIGVEVAVVQASIWWPGTATLLILAGIVIGLLGYWLAMRMSRIRRVRTYIGGEQMQDVYLGGETPGQDRHVELTGVHFYDTLEQLPLLGRLFVMGRARVFDIYYLCRNGTDYLVQLLRSFHNGILPAYLRWFVAGMLVVVWVVTQSGS